MSTVPNQTSASDILGNNDQENILNKLINRQTYFQLPVRRLRRSDVPQLEQALGPLHRFARDGRTEDVAVVLGLKQRPVDERDDAKQTPLHYATGKKDNTKCITLLLAHGADPNARDFWGGTPLHNAVRVGCYTGVKTLLSCSATTPSSVDLRRWSPLHFAVTFRRLDMVKLLIEHGANMTIMNEAGVTPMMLAKSSRFHEIINYLIEASTRELV